MNLLLLAATLPSLWGSEPVVVREMINQKIMSIKAPTPEVDAVQEELVERSGRSVRLRLYKPSAAKNLPVILFIHGGGWVAGNLDTHDNLARYLCQKAEAVTVSVDYSLSPEAKFPLPLEQCYDALLWVQEHLAPTQLAVVGDSAGGTMAAALCLLARDRQGPDICQQVLINPSPDLTWDGTLVAQNDAYDSLRWFTRQYVQDPNDVQNPYVSPSLAKDLTQLPPALILLAENDIQRATGQVFADRLKEAKVLVNVYTQWDMGHLAGDGARVSERAQESIDVAVCALKAAFR